MAEIAAMGKNQLVLSFTARVKWVGRPFRRSETDEKYGWDRQLILFEDDLENTLSAIIYSDTMHLGSDAVGEVWRFRCMNSDSGPKGIAINKWSKKIDGGTEEMVELKIHSDADMTRFQFADGRPQNQEPPAPAEPPQQDMAFKLTPKDRAVGTEQRVIIDLDKYCPDPLAPEINFVAVDIADRQGMGIAKYGQTVEQNDLGFPAWLQHAYEEKLDATIYLRRSIEQADKDKAREGRAVWPGPMKLALIDCYKRTMADALMLKRMMLDIAHENASGDPAMAMNPEQQPGPPSGDSGYVATPEHDRRGAARFVAANLRWNYTDEAETTPAQRDMGLEAIRLMKDLEIGYDEVYDVLTARDRRENPELLDRAFDTALQRVRVNRPTCTPDQMCEAVCKSPGTFRLIINELAGVQA